MPNLTRRVAVVTDSASSLTQDMGQEYGLDVVPMHVAFEGHTYRDGIDLDPDSFYRQLRTAPRLPTTSQPSVADFSRVYASLQDGVEAIVSIHVSRQLSATIDAATFASRETAGVPIHILDSYSVSAGEALIALAAARAAAAGKDASEIVGLVAQLRQRTHMFFMVDTLEYLHKGGRIGGAATLLGMALRIKPILSVQAGRIEACEKPRTRSRALGRLMSLVAEHVEPSARVHLAVLHCAAPEEARALAEQLADRFPCEELLSVETGPAIAVHSGPGALGLAFYTIPGDAAPIVPVGAL